MEKLAQLSESIEKLHTNTSTERKTSTCDRKNQPLVSNNNSGNNHQHSGIPYQSTPSNHHQLHQHHNNQQSSHHLYQNMCIQPLQPPPSGHQGNSTPTTSNHQMTGSTGNSNAMPMFIVTNPNNKQTGTTTTISNNCGTSNTAL